MHINLEPLHPPAELTLLSLVMRVLKVYFDTDIMTPLFFWLMFAEHICLCLYIYNISASLYLMCVKLHTVGFGLSLILEIFIIH